MISMDCRYDTSGSSFLFVNVLHSMDNQHIPSQVTKFLVLWRQEELFFMIKKEKDGLFCLILIRT